MQIDRPAFCQSIKVDRLSVFLAKNYEPILRGKSSFFSNPGFDSQNISFILKNIGIMIIPLDFKEVQAVMELSGEEYDYFSKSCMLKGQIGYRDYFGSQALTHTGWDLLEFIAKKIFSDDGAEFNEEILLIFDDLECILSSRKFFDDHPDSLQALSEVLDSLFELELGDRVGSEVLHFLCKFGSFCRGKIVQRA